ncbi:MAG: phosphotransacetylase [Elusimicrobia bacterium]|nr:phosphotransacetylase [Candidatus Liberimonas magnetica]
MVFKKFIEDAKKLKGKIIFGEGDEERTIEAAARLAEDGVCKTAAVTVDKKNIEKIAKDKKIDVSMVEILVPALELIDKDVLAWFIETRAAKGLAEEDAKKLALEPLHFSALYVKSGKANGCVSGARSATSDVLRAALHGIGTSKDTKLISSFFLMVPPQGHPLVKKPILYSDCGVNPNPNTLGLKDIAVASVSSFRCLFPEEPPKMAFLSFSTKGSAQHRVLEKVIEASKLTQEYFKDDAAVKVDGELQFDAAIVPSVGQRKSPKSPVAGQANIFIFPDLNAGNICYKATERLGQFTAIGPIVQGLAMPFNDLSRGCSVQDIYHAAIITLLQSKNSNC